MIEDSGNRREFESGAVRDMAEGKGRFDLTALDEVAEFMFEHYKSFTLHYIAEFWKTHKVHYLRIAVNELCKDEGIDMCTAMIRYSQHAEKGAKKYGEGNVKLGIPTHSFLDSAVRHYVKYIRGDKDEDHWSACIWNLVWLIWTIHNRPECDDLKKEEE